MVVNTLVTNVGSGSVWIKGNLQQGIDGSARKPALRQDTGYMVEKTYTAHWAKVEHFDTV